MTYLKNIQGILKLIDRCSVHADILNKEIENIGDERLKSSYLDKLTETIRQTKMDYLKKACISYPKGGSCEKLHY